MEELIGLVAQKTGLPPDRARAAVETVLTYLKGKLPSALGGQIDQAIGRGGGGGGLSDLAKGLGGMLGQ
jgi:hypothetical protein